MSECRGGWTYLESTVPTRQSGSDTRNFVKDVWKNIMNSLISFGYSSGLIKIEDLSVDSNIVVVKKGGNKYH